MAEPFWAATVRQLRQDKGWTQGELATQADVRENTLSDALNGKTSPRLDTLTAVATALGVPLWRLFVDARQAELLTRQELADAAVSRESDIAARVEQLVMTKLASLVKEATKEIATGQSTAPPANPLPSPRPTLAEAPRQKRKHVR